MMLREHRSCLLLYSRSLRILILPFEQLFRRKNTSFNLVLPLLHPGSRANMLVVVPEPITRLVSFPFLPDALLEINIILLAFRSLIVRRESRIILRSPKESLGSAVWHFNVSVSHVDQAFMLIKCVTSTVI